MSIKGIVGKLADHQKKGKGHKHEFNLRTLDDGSVHVRHTKEGEYPGKESSHKTMKHALKHVASMADGLKMHQTGMMIDDEKGESKGKQAKEGKEGTSGY